MNRSAHADLNTTLSQWLNPVDQTPHPAVVRITVPEKDAISYGSGTLVDRIGPYGIVMTNWHVVRDSQGEVWVTFPNGYHSRASIGKTDEDWDLAALVVWSPAVTPMPLASAAPQPGEPLTIAGYGQGSYRAVRGACTQYVAPSLQHPFEMVELSVTARQGDSGGPIINDHGQLSGVLFGSSRHTTSGSYVGRVKTFLTSVTDSLRQSADKGSGTELASSAFSHETPGSSADGTDLRQEMSASAGPANPGALNNNYANYADTNPSASPFAPTPSTERATSAYVASRHSATLGAPRWDDEAQDNFDRSEEGGRATDRTRMSPSPVDDGLAWAQDEAARATVAMDGDPSRHRAEPRMATSELITWSELAGATRWEQGKSILAMIGILAILAQLAQRSAKSSS